MVIKERVFKYVPIIGKGVVYNEFLLEWFEKDVSDNSES